MMSVSDRTVLAMEDNQSSATHSRRDLWDVCYASQLSLHREKSINTTSMQSLARPATSCSRPAGVLLSQAFRERLAGLNVSGRDDELFFRRPVVSQFVHSGASRTSLNVWKTCVPFWAGKRTSRKSPD